MEARQDLQRRGALKMKRRTRLGLAAAMGLFATGQAAGKSAGDVFGLWQHPENGSRIEIYPCAGLVCARIVRASDGQGTDTKNPDPNLRGRPVVGLVIIAGASQTGTATWSGDLYNRIDGRTYAGRIKLKSTDRIDLTGCMAVVLCRTVSWRRVSGNH